MTPKLSDFDPATFGAPDHPHRHHRTRLLISIGAAAAGALAVLVIGFLVVAWVGPGDGPVAWIILAALVVVWLTGFWWRWDSPDRRLRRNERERRGF